jgi:hypothetical protein
MASPPTRNTGLANAANAADFKVGNRQAYKHPKGFFVKLSYRVGEKSAFVHSLPHATKAELEKYAAEWDAMNAEARKQEAAKIARQRKALQRERAEEREAELEAAREAEEAEREADRLTREAEPRARARKTRRSTFQPALVKLEAKERLASEEWMKKAARVGAHLLDVYASLQCEYSAEDILSRWTSMETDEDIDLRIDHHSAGHAERFLKLYKLEFVLHLCELDARRHRESADDVRGLIERMRAHGDATKTVDAAVLAAKQPVLDVILRAMNAQPTPAALRLAERTLKEMVAGRGDAAKYPKELPAYIAAVESMAAHDAAGAALDDERKEMLRAARTTVAAAEEEQEELCDFEVERQKNIARNDELLRQLNLA